MSPIVKNILAVVAAIVVGWIVNMGLITLSPSIIPLPDGVDPTNTESLKANIGLFEPKHFIMPFLAHALGTLTAAYTAARIAASHKFKFALGLGVFFLLGGIAAVMMIPAPIWFNILDLVGAYIPMAWIGYKMATIADRS